MEWEQQLAAWCGRQVEVGLEGIAGKDPLTTPRVFVLEKVHYSAERTHMKF
jgi:hypothetical protein